MQIVTYENRLRNLSSLKLLVLSARDNFASATIHIPSHGMPEQALDWLLGQSNVTLHDDIRLEGDGWNVKISVLTQALGKLGGRVTWMDADVIIQGAPEKLFQAASQDTLLICEEAYRGVGRGSDVRVRGLGLVRGHELGYTANTSVVSVTERHRALLDRWAELSRLPAYLEQQKWDYADRDLHFVGDQDLMTALLGSREFRDLDVQPLSSGVDIAHSMLPADFPLGQRLATIFRGEPSLVHAQGLKVWLHGDAPEGRSMACQLSAYRLAAKQYRGDLQAEDQIWLDGNQTVVTKILTGVFSNRPSLTGLPLGFAGTVRKTLSKIKQVALGGLRSIKGSGTQDPSLGTSSSNEP